MLKTFFIKYSPIILLLPLSAAVGIYFIESIDLLYAQANHFYFYYYALLAIAPLYFLFLQIKPEVSNEFLHIFNRFIENFKRNKWEYVFSILTVFALFIVAANHHISTYTERDRWILGDDLPIIPIDAPIPLRVAWVLSHVLPIDLAVPSLGIFSMLVWFSFLIYVHGGENGKGWLVLLVFVFTFINKSFFELLYANFELPAAIFGWIGLYGIWRRRINLGFFFVILSTVWKNTGIFQLVVALFLGAFVLYKDRIDKQNVYQKIDVTFLIFLLVYFILNYWGSFYYMFAFRGGPGYVVASEPQRIIWFSSFVEFMQNLAKNYFAVFVLGIIGTFISRTGFFSFLSLGVLIFIRCFSQLSSFYYPLIFLPGLSFFAYFSLVRISGFINNRIIWFLINIFMLFATVFQFVVLFPSYPFGMSRLNSNFDEFIGKMARRFPEDGRIYERDISLMPYLKFARGGDLDAIEFRVYPDEKAEFMNEFSQPGCKLIVAEKRHLEIVGITDTEMISLGYSEKPYVLLDNSGTWVAYSKECNAWEYN